MERGFDVHTYGLTAYHSYELNYKTPPTCGRVCVMFDPHRKSGSEQSVSNRINLYALLSLTFGCETYSSPAWA